MGLSPTYVYQKGVPFSHFFPRPSRGARLTIMACFPSRDASSASRMYQPACRSWITGMIFVDIPGKRELYRIVCLRVAFESEQSVMIEMEENIDRKKEIKKSASSHDPMVHLAEETVF